MLLIAKNEPISENNSKIEDKKKIFFNPDGKIPVGIYDMIPKRNSNRLSGGKSYKKKKSQQMEFEEVSEQNPGGIANKSLKRSLK